MEAQSKHSMGTNVFSHAHTYIPTSSKNHPKTSSKDLKSEGILIYMHPSTQTLRNHCKNSENEFRLSQYTYVYYQYVYNWVFIVITILFLHCTCTESKSFVLMCSDTSYIVYRTGRESHCVQAHLFTYWSRLMRLVVVRFFGELITIYMILVITPIKLTFDIVK